MKKRVKTMKNFGVRIPEELLEKLRYVARYECRSASGMLRVLAYSCVEDFEREHGEILFSPPVDREKTGE